MERKFSVEAKTLRNITLFTPEASPENPTGETEVVIKISGGKLTFRILSFRYLLLGTESVDVNDDFELILPLKKMQDIVKTFSDDTKMNFSVGHETVSITADGVKFKLKLFDEANVSPALEKGESEEYTVSREKFLEGLKRVRVAIGDDEVRYYLNGVHTEILKDGKDNTDVFFVATSGHLLATFGDKNSDCKVIQKSIIPKKVIPDIIKILEKSGQDVKVSFTKNKMDVKTENLEIIIKLIEAEFPDYERVIPKENKNQVSINVEQFKTVVGKISTISNTDKSREVRLTSSSGVLSLETISQDGTMGSGEITLEGSKNDKLETKLNIKYVMDILSQFTDKTAIVKFIDGSSPLLIEQESGKSPLFVVMPIRS